MTTRILVGDVRERLADLPDGHYHCVITSPPYFGLRDYGTAQWDGGDPACDHRHDTKHQQQGATSQRNGRSNVDEQRNESFRATCGKCGAVRIDSQLGLEPTLADYIAALVDVFRSVRRVLRDDGVLFVNIGDSYASAWPCRRRNVIGAGSLENGTRENRPPRMPDGLKEKDLMLVPFRLALALQDDGWYVRSSIIWHKRAPMPESVTDRPTSAHEHIFLLTKQPRYFYDADAVREESTPNMVWRAQNGHTRGGNGKLDASRQDHDTLRGEHAKAIDAAGRNQRNVWTLSPEPFPEAHFATFPTEIPRRAIKAGTSERGCCAECGAPWVRVVEKSVAFGSGSGKAGNQPNGKWHETAQTESGTYDIRMGPQVQSVTTGWQPSCSCAAAVVPCRVLDPFSGSGTTGVVCVELGRDYTGIELSPEYAAMSERRIADVQPPLFVLAQVGA